MNNEYQYEKMYWEEMMQVKYSIYYIDYYIFRTERIDNSIKIFLAIVSSASIGGWAIWSKFAYFWGTLIAVSQVINAIKPHLPFEKRKKNLYALNREWNKLFIDMEKSWFDVSRSLIDDEEIYKRLMNFREVKEDSRLEIFSDTCLPKNEKLKIKAEKDTEKYFTKYY